jgi:hypothetical protein
MEGEGRTDGRRGRGREEESACYWKQRLAGPAGRVGRAPGQPGAAPSPSWRTLGALHARACPGREGQSGQVRLQRDQRCAEGECAGGTMKAGIGAVGRPDRPRAPNAVPAGIASRRPPPPPGQGQALRGCVAAGPGGGSGGGGLGLVEPLPLLRTRRRRRRRRLRRACPRASEGELNCSSLGPTTQHVVVGRLGSVGGGGGYGGCCCGCCCCCRGCGCDGGGGGRGGVPSPCGTAQRPPRAQAREGASAASWQAGRRPVGG